MPRQRTQDPTPDPTETEAMRRAREAETAAEQVLAAARQQRERQEREDAVQAAREAERLTKIAEARGRLRPKLDAAHSRITRALPFDGIPEDIKAAMVEYAEAVGPLGERSPDQQLIEHPIGRFMPFLALFAARPG